MKTWRSRTGTAPLPFLVAALLASCLTVPPQAAETARLYVEMTTTSDHTGLTFGNGSGVLFGENVSAFVVELPEPRISRAPLGYDAASLDELVDGWAAAIIDFDVSAIPFYWPDATHTTIVPGHVYETHNAHDLIIEEEESGPQPDVDYDAIEFSKPLRIPARDGEPPKLLCVSSYRGVPSGTDLFWFEERDGRWGIVRHMWRIGIDVLQ
ncbi:MAG: hypothetical protein ACOC1U_01150 [Spirochaetota bacterium]